MKTLVSITYNIVWKREICKFLHKNKIINCIINYVNCHSRVEFLNPAR